MIRIPRVLRVTNLLLFLVLCCTGARSEAAEVTAAKRQEAREHYENGSRKFDVGKFDEAATEFQLAYELVGDPAILYNIAKSYQLGQNPERARFFYQSYLRRVDNPANKAEVVGRINDLNQVLQQQKRVNETPPTGILKAPPEVKKTPETKPPETKPPETKPPEKRPEVVRPPEPPPEQPPPEQPPPEQPPAEPKAPSPPRTAMWKGIGFACVGLAAAGLALGGAMSGAAASNSSAVETAAKQGDPFSSELRDVESRGKTFDTVAIAGYVVGGVAAVGAAVSLYFAYRPQKTSTTAIAPSISSGHAGLLVSGSF